MGLGRSVLDLLLPPSSLDGEAALSGGLSARALTKLLESVWAVTLRGSASMTSEIGLSASWSPATRIMPCSTSR